MLFDGSSLQLPLLNVPILVKTFVAVFVLADALGNAPIFLALTKDQEPEQKHRTVNRATLVATAVLLGFAFVGQSVLNYLHISMGSLRVAGGLLLLLIALQMLSGELDTPMVEEGRDVAITPLALPLLAGPGTLTTVMLLMAESPDAHFSVVIGIVAAMLLSWLIVRLAAQIDHLIGAEGAVIVTQLAGFLLAALAVEIGSAGIRELFLMGGSYPG
jgi:multiple antibiotic resistance protein